jgi:hypothetical protein
MANGRTNAEPERREVCFIQARRLKALRPSIIYEALTRRSGEYRVIASSDRVPATHDGLSCALMQLTEELQRAGWEPTQEPLVMGPNIMAIFTRPLHRDEP